MNTNKPEQIKSRETLKSYFMNGMLPDENRFADLINAMVHRDDVIAEPAVPPVEPIPEPKPEPEPPGDKETMTVPADGKRHVIKRALNGCHAFEIIASASGKGACHAITHAVALMSVDGSRSGVRHTSSYLGWYWRRKIRLEWKKSDDGYTLRIGTGANFGLDNDGQPFQIRYRIKQLW